MSLTDSKRKLDGQRKKWFPPFSFKKRKPVYLIRCPECRREFKIFPKKRNWRLIKLRCGCGVVFVVLKPDRGFYFKSSDRREEIKIFYKGEKHE